MSFECRRGEVHSAIGGAVAWDLAPQGMACAHGLPKGATPHSTAVSLQPVVALSCGLSRDLDGCLGDR